MTKTL